MNNKGQTIFYTLMLGVLIVILALSLTPIVNTFTTDARNVTDDTRVGLDCSNDTITDYQKAQCVMVDVATPYFFFGLLGIALLVIGAKVVLS